MSDNQTYVSKELADKLLTVTTQSMDGTKHPTNDRYTMKMSKGGDLTSFVRGHNLKPVDRCLLDGDLFSLANKFWYDELYNGSFFEIPGLLDQWCDLSVRTRDDVKRMLQGFLDDEVFPTCEAIAHQEQAAKEMKLIDHD